METDMTTPMSTFSLGSGKTGDGDIPLPENKQMIRDNETDLATIYSRLLPPTANTSVVGDVLTLDGNYRPFWGEGGLPSGASDGDIIYWDDTGEEWLTLPGPTSDGRVLYGTATGDISWSEVLAALAPSTTGTTADDVLVSTGSALTPEWESLANIQEIIDMKARITANELDIIELDIRVTLIEAHLGF